MKWVRGPFSELALAGQCAAFLAVELAWLLSLGFVVCRGRAAERAGRLARALTHAKEADMAAALASVGEDVRARLRRALRAAARAST